MESKNAIAALAALAHEGRLAIFRQLVMAGPDGLTVGEIAKKLAMAGATLSFHLLQLKHARLVTVRRVGRQLIQTADFDCMNALIAYLTENCCDGQACAPMCKPTVANRSKRAKVANG